MRTTVFRINDIRGEISTDMTVADMAGLAHAVSSYLRLYDPGAKTIALGRDGRVHSLEIFEQMAVVFQERGFDVLNLGLCPTPVTQFMVHAVPIDLGITITASHNGPSYNGCKFVHKKRPLWGAQIAEIRRLYYEQQQIGSAEKGTRWDYTDSVQRYVSFLSTEFGNLKHLQERIVFDCGNGATGAVMPLLIEAMQWPHAELLYAEVDGTFPHHEADPVIPENMRDLARHVLSSNARYGIGFDGDGDRMGAVTGEGKHVRGDMLLALYARDILDKNPQSHIVYDGKCAHVVSEVIAQAGGFSHESPSGSALIREYMRMHGALFGGELSCHFFFADTYFGYDDGIYAALRLVDLLERKKSDLHQLLAALPQSYVTEELRFYFSDDEKHQVVERIAARAQLYAQVKSISRLDGIRVTTEAGWWLLRASQTQPAICVRSESSSIEGIEQLGAMLHTIFMQEGMEHEAGRSFATWLGTAVWDRQLV